jgi:hypothetical protein
LRESFPDGDVTIDNPLISIWAPSKGNFGELSAALVSNDIYYVSPTVDFIKELEGKPTAHRL